MRSVEQIPWVWANHLEDPMSISRVASVINERGKVKDELEESRTSRKNEADKYSKSRKATREKNK